MIKVAKQLHGMQQVREETSQERSCSDFPICTSNMAVEPVVDVVKCAGVVDSPVVGGLVIYLAEEVRALE